MKVTTKEQAPREAVLSIELDQPEVEPYLDRAYRQVVQRATIPGFRKGKAPRRIVEQLLGRDYLLGQALDFMVPEVTNKAVAEAGLEIGGLPSVNVEQLDPPSITATVPLTPTVDLGAYRELRIARPKVEVKPDRVDEEMERIRWAVAPWEPVEEPAALGDLLNVTVKGRTEGKEIVNMERADFIPREGARVPAPGFAEELVGMRAYETKEFAIAVPEDFEYSEVAGKECHFEVVVHIVKRKVPGQMDDEFAKGVGSGYESLMDMRSKIEAEIAKNEEQLITSRHQEEAIEKVLEGTTFVMSPLIVDHELEHLLSDYQEALRTGRMTFEQYQRYINWAGKSGGEIREAARPEAEARIMRSLVLEKVVEEQELTVEEDEIATEIERLAEGSGADSEQVREMFQEEERRDSLRRMLLNRKAMETLSNMTADTKGPPAARRRASATTRRSAKRPAAETKRRGKQA